MLAVRMSLLITLLASFFLLMVTASNATAANSIALDRDTIPTMATKVLLDADGGVHILWAVHPSNLTRTSPGIWYARFATNGTNSIPPTRIRNSTNVESADMVLDSKDNVHVIWAEGPAFSNSTLNLLSSSADSQLYYAEINSTDNRLTNVTSLTGFGKIAMWPSITVDQWSACHIVWMEEDLNPRNRTLSEYYGTIHDNHLDRPTLIAQYTDQSFLDVPHPQIAYDENYSAMHIAWTYSQDQNSAITSDVSYAKINISNRQVTRLSVADLREPVEETTVTSGPNGSAYVVWQSPTASLSSVVYVSKISSNGKVMFLRSYSESNSLSAYLTTSSDSQENLYLIWYAPPTLSQPPTSNISTTSVKYLRINDEGLVTDSADQAVSGTVLAIGVSTGGDVYAVSSSGLMNIKPPVLGQVAQLMLGVVACCAAGFALTEDVRYRIIASLTPVWSDLYRSRYMKTDDQAILKMLADKPGAGLREIKRRAAAHGITVSLNNLAQLERAGYISSVRVGLARRFFDSIPADLMSSKMIPTLILNEIKRSPGIWEGKLAHDLALSQQIVHYHLKRMMSAGLLDAELDGRRKLYRLANSHEPKTKS